MEQLIIQFLSLPKIVIYGIFGAVGGVVGVLLGDASSKLFRINKASQIVTIICVVLAIQAPNWILPFLEKKVAPISVMQELKSQRLFSVIFRLHPEAEGELRTKMEDIINNSPDDQVFYRAQAASAEVISKYYQKHLLSASDELTYRLLKRNLEMLRKFQNKPEICVGYFLGQPQFDKEDVTPEFIADESNLKADVIESAVNNPSLPPKAANPESLLQIISAAYEQRGYDIDNLAKIGQIATLPVEEGCKISIEFSDVLLSFGVQQSAYLFKNLMYMGQE